MNTKTCPYLSIAFLINNNESLNYKENNLHKLSYLCLGLARDCAPVQVKPWRGQDHFRLNTIYISPSPCNCHMIHNNPLMEYSPNLNIRHECLSSKAPNYENIVGDRCRICYLDHGFSRAVMAALVKYSREKLIMGGKDKQTIS